MRIALLTPGFSKDEQDWCIPFLYDLVKELAAQHDVHVFALRYPPYPATYRFFGATVHAIGGHHTISGWRRLRLWQQTAAAIHAEHGRAPFDVIHAIWADETGFLAHSMGRRLGIPSVVTVTGGEAVYIPKIGYGLQNGRFQRWLVRRALRADAVIAPSQTQAGLIKALAPAARVTVAPFGVDTDLFTPLTLPPHPPRLIAAGSLIPVKNHALLLHALAGLQTPDVQLEIAGEGVLQPVLEQLARDLQIADRVVFAGKVDHGALASHFQQADLHVLTSHHEGFGLVNIEAAACGLPTVGFAVGVVPELEALGAAITVTPDAGALTAAIDALLSDEERRHVRREQALNAARTRYSLAAMVEGVIQTYTALAS
jgi:glycosyltransferase involved in cell wall biosynthesis